MPKVGVRMVEGQRVQVLHKRTEDASPLMHRIGVYLARISRLAFRNQRFGSAIWAPKSASATHPSVMGVVQDLAQGSTVLPPRFAPRPALHATGALERSITAEPAGPKTVRVRSSAPYASLHQDGGTSTAQVTPEVKRNLASFLKTRADLRPALGFLFRRDEVSAGVPARPFLGVTDNAKKHIHEMVLRFLGQKGP